MEVAQMFRTLGWLLFVPTMLIWRGRVIYPLLIVTNVTCTSLVSLSLITSVYGDTVYLANIFDSSDCGSTWNFAFKSELFLRVTILVSG